jgi:hypothetical protein
VDAAHFSGWYLNLKMNLSRRVVSAHPHVVIASI